MSAPPAIDQSRLRSVSGGDPAIARELLDLLIEEAVPLLDDLRVAVAARDRSALREGAHALKGIASNVGAAGVQSVAAAVERASVESPWPDLETSLASVAGALDELQAAMRENR